MFGLRTLPGQIEGRRPGTFQLGLRLSQRGARFAAGLVFVVDYLQIALIGLDTLLIQGDLLIHNPQLEIILRQFGLRAQCDVS